MKSPWNFLTRLTSRRKPDDAEQSSVGQDDSRKTIEAEAEKAPALLLSPPEVEPDVDRDGSAASDEGATTSSTEAEEAPAVSPVVEIESAQPIAEDAKPAKAERTKRTRRLKAEIAKPVVAETAPARAEDQATQSLPVENPVLDEMAKLDEDIRILRSELTRKLTAQNAYLKKMLERFDRS